MTNETQSELEAFEKWYFEQFQITTHDALGDQHYGMQVLHYWWAWQAARTPLLAELKMARDALNAVDELWGGDAALAKEMAACEKLGAKLPVTIVWYKIRDTIAKLDKTLGDNHG